MQDLEFYEIKKDGVVFVRQKSTEFFALYSPTTKKWCQPDNITFMQLTHDYDYTQITKQEAFNKTDQKALATLLQSYLSILKSNYDD